MEVCENGGVATSGFSGPVFKICLTFNCCQNPISVTFSSSFYPSSVFQHSLSLLLCHPILPIPHPSNIPTPTHPLYHQPHTALTQPVPLSTPWFQTHAMSQDHVRSPTLLLSIYFWSSLEWFDHESKSFNPLFHRRNNQGIYIYWKCLLKKTLPIKVDFEIILRYPLSFMLPQWQYTLLGSPCFFRSPKILLVLLSSPSRIFGARTGSMVISSRIASEYGCALQRQSQ